MQFGFSWLGLAYMIMLLVPNILWTRYKPAGYDQQAARENRVLVVLERIGEVLVTGSALFTTGKGASPWWLAVSLALMLLYELYWVRYFRSARTMADFYGPLAGVPVPGASLPVAAFFLLAVFGQSPLLAAADVILGIGHIGIHLAHWNDCRPAVKTSQH